MNRVCWNTMAPSADDTVTTSGNVPDARVSTAKRVVVLCGSSVSTWSAPLGKKSFSLCSRTRTVMGCVLPFWNEIGIAARRAVIVTVVC